MIPISIGLMLILSATTGLAQGAGPPMKLHGKSAILSWHEKRLQKRDDEDHLKTVNVSVELRLYFSAASRVFSRMDRTINGRKRKSAVRQRAPGGSLTGGAGRFGFTGRQLLIENTYASGARRIIVKFDEAFNDCNVEIIQGKESGQKMMRIKSMITGAWLDVHSITTSELRCSVQAGNVFADR